MDQTACALDGRDEGWHGGRTARIEQSSVAEDQALARKRWCRISVEELGAIPSTTDRIKRQRR